MKLTTIWTLRGMDLRERINRTTEVAWSTAAAHLPRQLAFYSFIHQGVRHIESNEIVTDVPYTVVLSRMPLP